VQLVGLLRVLGHIAFNRESSQSVTDLHIIVVSGVCKQYGCGSESAQ